MKRRDWLTMSPLLLTTAKGNPGKPVIGQGAYRYEVEHDCLQLPEKIKFGNTHGIVVAGDGSIIVAHTVHKTSAVGDAICVFDAKGKFVRSWGADLRGGAHGLTLRKEGPNEYLYHCDNVQGYVRKTTLSGELVWVMQAPIASGVYKKASEYKPSNLAIAPNGHIFVADGYGKFYIHEFDERLRWVKTFGGSREWMDRDKNAETPSGTTIWPHAIAIDPRGPEPMLMVGERGANSRIQYFSLDGKPGAIVKNGVRWPSTFDFRQGLMLMPDLKAVVTLFNERNEPVVQLGDGRQPDGKTYEDLRTKDRSAFPAGKFIAPHAAAFDAHGNIYVAEWVEVGRVTRLRLVG